MRCMQPLPLPDAACKCKSKADTWTWQEQWYTNDMHVKMILPGRCDYWTKMQQRTAPPRSAHTCHASRNGIDALRSTLFYKISSEVGETNAGEVCRGRQKCVAKRMVIKYNGGSHITKATAAIVGKKAHNYKRNYKLNATPLKSDTRNMPPYYWLRLNCA